MYKRQNPELSTEYWSFENALDSNFMRSINAILSPKWHRISYESKQLVKDISTLRKLLNALISYDALDFYELIQLILDANKPSVTRKYSESPWLLAEESQLVISFAKKRVIDNGVYNLESLPKWEQLCALLDDIAPVSYTHLDVYKRQSELGEMIHNVKPIFLFAPEFGVININALAMELQSTNNSEINTALNSLLVVSSDNTLSIPLHKCTELLDNLCILACQLLNKLHLKNYSRITGKYADFEVNEWVKTPNKHLTDSDNQIDQIFEQMKNKYESNQSEHTVKVDSLTGIDFSQLPITPIEPEFEMAVSKVESVSYTHLDVYKRQAMG